MDWQQWHDRYDAPESPLAWRLRAVQDRIGAALDAAPPGPLRVISLCAGQGRDLLGVLPAHPRREDVRARLVERDLGNVAEVRRTATALGLPGVEAVVADAALLDHCADLVPADLVLLCGVFGNITSADIERTVEACTQLCAPGAPGHLDPPSPSARPSPPDLRVVREPGLRPRVDHVHRSRPVGHGPPLHHDTGSAPTGRQGLRLRGVRQAARPGKPYSP
ncbi:MULTISPECIES: SAM-dependent methyltransferase [Streptomyces]|uniref:SAM-dependent methyltransferase n=1 Tax=Streptomyces TaxID=1883 RepID=UPI003684FC49